MREFCDEHGIMLIVDEIQSGFGRTGHWASWQHYGVQPDISTYAKSLGSGMPIAAVLGRAEIMDAAAPGTIGGTYIGNPSCCVAALATIKYMKEEKLMTEQMLSEMLSYKVFINCKKIPEIGDVRGIGAMVGMEFVFDPRQPNGALCDGSLKVVLKKGL